MSMGKSKSGLKMKLFCKCLRKCWHILSKGMSFLCNLFLYSRHIVVREKHCMLRKTQGKWILENNGHPVLQLATPTNMTLYYWKHLRLVDFSAAVPAWHGARGCGHGGDGYGEQAAQREGREVHADAAAALHGPAHAAHRGLHAAAHTAVLRHQRCEYKSQSSTVVRTSTLCVVN